MFSLNKPSNHAMDDFIAAQRDLPFSYQAVGATQQRQPPHGYPINRYRGQLGAGEALFARAMIALSSWQMYRLGWTTLYPAPAVAAAGTVVIVRASHLGFWSLNPCRVVYTIDEDDGDFRRVGLAIGTLPAHSEAGEEQFLVTWNRADDTVWYELYAFAKAKNLLAKIGAPYVTRLQKQFAAQSYEAMLQAVR